ncbi:MAG: 2,3-bisphosphoglycerate-independent phosphoglycerate mutase [Verrucomicrobia bacterium]|nr:2,3-bisphosphoglycerate-independent phosphoglycerate mutase [Verrucomicrobiota bacterium]
MTATTHRPVVLVIRDGWGHNPDPSHNEFNAVRLAKHPVDDRLLRECPHTLIKTCGLDVGLPQGVMGNSEVGHQNIGAGRVVDQEIVRIDKAIASGAFFKNPAALGAVEFARQHHGRLHVMGLISDAGVHATIDHLMACVEIGKRNGLSEVFIHAITDGRDTPPMSGIGYVRQVEDRCAKLGAGQIATVGGRYYIMDRDKRWDRVQRAYDCLVAGSGHRARNAADALQTYYANPSIPTMKGDEFVPPCNIVKEDGSPVATIGSGDAIIFANFRGDRPREITRALVDPDFKGFAIPHPLNIYFTTMTEYEPGLAVHPLFFKPEKMHDILGMYISRLGLNQFRCAETEKYPHVTFFFNDYRDEPFESEERVIVPSPKVATYDLQPEMSAEGVCAESVRRLQSRKFALGVINFANPDMVGHTGSLPAAIRAVETVDACVGRVLEAAQKAGASALVTADHGNCEQMYDPVNRCPHTSHTLNDVALVVVDEKHKRACLRSGGRLADVAPTLLDMMEIAAPPEMRGRSLLQAEA